MGVGIGGLEKGETCGDIEFWSLPSTSALKVVAPQRQWPVIAMVLVLVCWWLEEMCCVSKCSFAEESCIRLEEWVSRGRAKDQVKLQRGRSSYIMTSPDPRVRYLDTRIPVSRPHLFAPRSLCAFSRIVIISQLKLAQVLTSLHGSYL